MSLIKLQGNASGTGAFTIAAPNGNTDRTLTLPDATGTVVTANGSGDIATTSITPSAGIYLGGSGSANLLDDYEEGTFTPSWVGVTGVSLVYAKYLKIGNTVNIWVRFTATGGITANSSRFTGLPFSATTLSSGTWTRGTVEGGFIEQQTGTTCYFASAPSAYTGTFQANLIYSTQ